MVQLYKSGVLNKLCMKTCYQHCINIVHHIVEIVPEKKTRSDDDEDDNPVKTDYEEWKRKILENAAKLNDKS